MYVAFFWGGESSPSDKIPTTGLLRTCTIGKRKNMLFFLLSCLFQFVEVRCSKRRPPGPQAGERCCSPGEQHMVGLSKLSVHDSIEHRVDTAVEPGEVSTEHVQNPWGTVMFVSYVD